jgi:hypothetical protein
MKIKKINLKGKKAQVWGLDLAIGLMVFVGIIFMFYRYSVSFVPEGTSLEKMIQQGGFVSESLLSQGYPENWNETNDINQVRMFGLLDNNSLLDANKWTKFAEWSDPNGEYSLVKEKLNTDFAFYIFFSKEGDTDPKMSINGYDFAGKGIPDDAKQTTRVERLVAYNDTGTIIPLKMVLFLWSYQKT